jgi:hypothetical protein
MDLTDEELEEQVRTMARNVSWGASSYVEELRGRQVDRQTRQSIALTEEIRRLTSQIRWLTGAAIALAVISLAVALVAVTRG